MNTKQRTTAFIGVLLLLLSGTLLSAQNASQSPETSMSAGQRALYELGFDIPQAEIEAPPFSLTDLDGKTASLENVSGKLLLLNLWATWCPPCRAEMPSMQKLYDRFSGKNFEMYAVAGPAPPRETLEKIEDYIQEGGYSFPVPIDTDLRVNAMYGTGSIPTTWLISPEGIIIARLVGSTDWMNPGIIAALEKLLP
jgi:thiol-disulfide isomerase/thioredoxin